MRAKGLTQQEIADTAGVGVGTVNRDLAGSDFPSGKPTTITNARGEQRPSTYTRTETEDVIAAAPGLDWVAGRVAQMRDESPYVIVAFDPIRTGDLTPDLHKVGVRDAGVIRRVVPVTSREFTLACDAVVRANREDRLLHGDPRLDAAALSATRSTFSDGKGWKLVGVDGADVSPLIAAALAVQTMRDQPRSLKTSERRAVFL